EWDTHQTTLFSEVEVQRLKNKLKSHITKSGIVQMSCEETRSQHKNKAMVIDRFLRLLEAGLQKPKERRKPKPGKKFHQKRLEEKKRRAEKKKNRKGPLS